MRLIVLLPMLLLASCSSDDVLDGDGAPVPVRFAVGSMLSLEETTRATGTGGDLHNAAFAAGDEIAIYLEPTAFYGTAPTTYTVGIDGTSLTTATPQLFPGTGTINVYAFYPASAVGGVRPTSISHAVQTDQTTADNFRASDLLMATPVMGQAKTSEAIPLTFNHQMAQVVICLKQGQHTGTPDVTLIKEELIGSTMKLTNARYRGTLDVAASTFTTDTDICDITAVSGKDLDFSTEHHLLLPPQTLTTATAVSITTGYGRTIAGQLGSSLTIEAGCSYVLNVTVNDTYLTVTPAISIGDWTKYKWTN